MLRCLLLFAAVPLMSQSLTPALMRWRQEIENRGTPVYITRADYDPARNTLSLPPEAPQREIFASYLRTQSFLNDFHYLYAASITHNVEGKTAYLILLNMARAEEWRDAQEAVVAHELGHLWLQSLGYPAPAYQPGPLSCVSMFAGDIVQHVLIRQELDRRQINHRGLMVRVLDATSRELSANPKPPSTDRCLLVRQAAQLADVILGMRDEPWPGREAYDAVWRQKLPDIEVPVAKIVRYLRNRDVVSPEAHSEAMKFTYEQLITLFLSGMTGEIIQQPAPQEPARKQ